VVNPVVKVDPWLVDQRVNYGLKNRPLRNCMYLAHSIKVINQISAILL